MVERSFVPEDAVEASGSGHERAHARDSLFLMGAIRRAAAPDQEISVKLRNLSACGLMAEAPVPFVRGEQIQVVLRGIGVVDGRIAWTAGGRIGVAFVDPIDPRLARRTIAEPSRPAGNKPARTLWRPGFS